jgi:DNA-binding transcriptional ArsR family regulator
MSASPRRATRDVTFRAVADPTRRAILDYLSEAPHSVTELCARFDVSQPAISQHLAVLRDAGLVSVTPEGKRRLYALSAEPLAEVHAWAAHYERFWNAHLDRLGEVLAKEAAEDEAKKRKKRER